MLLFSQQHLRDAVVETALKKFHGNQRVKNKVKGIMAGMPVKPNWIVTFKRTPQAMGRPVTNPTSLMPTTILQVIFLICHMSPSLIAVCTVVYKLTVKKD